VANTDNVFESSEQELESSLQSSFDSGELADSVGNQAIGSILVADCGSSFTRLALLERVEVGYCFVAHAITPTTGEPPWSDVSIGVRHAIEQITGITGLQLLDGSGTLIVPQVGGRGIDLFIATSSAGQPLRVVLTGLVSQVSLASLERAAASSYVQVLGTIARDGGGGSMSDEDKVAVIRRHHPDVVWVAGGTDGGCYEPVRDLVETVALACTLVDRPPRPAIVFVGNAELRMGIVDLVGEEVELKIIDNVRPALDVENLAPAQSVFQSSYVQRKLQRVPGIGSLIEWSDVPVMPTAQALGNLVTYLERLYESGKGVLCADVGSAATTVAASFAASHGQPALQVVTDLGVGFGAPALLKRIGVDAIAQWLPFESQPGEVEALLLNKGVRPTTIPQDRRQLLIEQAAAREALRFAIGQARQSWQPDTMTTRRWLTPPLEPIIATGGVLTKAPRPGQAVLMLLDAIEPIGVTTIVLDEHGLASALGAVAAAHPLAAVQALDAGAFLTLGTVVAPVGRARPGEVIMRAKITFERGGELEIEVKQGSLEVLPLRLGEKATLELRPRRGMSVGRIAKAVEVHGGVVGLVIDARGRPLRLLPDPEARRQQMQRWLWDMGA